jgi:hypothetical protein
LHDAATIISQQNVPATEAYSRRMQDLNIMLEEGMITQSEWNAEAQKSYDALSKANPEIQAAAKFMSDYADEADVLNGKIAELQALFEKGLVSPDIEHRGIDDLREKILELNPAFTELRDLAASVFEETRTPFEKLTDEFAKLDEMLLEGLIDMEAALRKAGMEMDASGLFDTPATRRTEAGSVSAGGLMGLAAQANIGGIQSNEQRMIEQQQRMTQLLEAIAMNTQTKMIAYA